MRTAPFSPAELVMAGFAGLAPPPELLALVRRGLAGVILFERNVADPAQVAALCAELQDVARRAGHPPLLIAADHEGGRVQRLRQGFTRSPAALALGAAADLGLIERLHRAVGSELAAVGINVNLAPCADVNVNPRNPVIGTRSFGADPGAVAACVAAAVVGLQAGGVAAVIKHFPGHGDTHLDSHHTLPVIDRPVAALRAVDLPPFAAGIAAGAAVMSAHIVVPGLTAKTPATLSQPALTGLLRGELGHAGLVMTDCLEMDAIAGRWPPADATIAALAAGADLVLWSHTPARQRAAVDAIAGAATDGTLAAEALAASAARVRAARRRWGGKGPIRAATDGGDNAARLAAAAYKAAVTLVDDPGRLVPLPPDRPVVVASLTGGPADQAAAALVRALRRGGRSAVAVEAAAAGRDDDRATVLGLCHDACLDPEQAARLAELVDRTGRRALVVAAGLPYDLAAVPGAGARICTYDPAGGAMQALAEVLCGLGPAMGRPPVRLADLAGQTGG